MKKSMKIENFKISNFFRKNRNFEIFDFHWLFQRFFLNICLYLQYIHSENAWKNHYQVLRFFSKISTKIISIQQHKQNRFALTHSQNTHILILGFFRFFYRFGVLDFSRWKCIFATTSTKNYLNCESLWVRNRDAML